MYGPGKTCKDVLSKHKSVTSGVYYIRPQGPSTKAFRVHCDMETYGGGWTLVYSYTFDSGNGVVTPRPNWPASSANVPISTTPPLDESSRGAIDYNLWKDIGQEFMVKSNINDWVVCRENGGGLVRKSNGGLSCRNIKNVATKCQNVAPRKIIWYGAGPSLHASSYFYFFDGSTKGNWPTHDPCGLDLYNQKKGVDKPGGAIYLR